MMVMTASGNQRRLASVSIAVALWSLGYALYRGYYAVGGTRFLPGTPADAQQFRLIKAVAVVILVIAAAVPLAMLLLWRRQKGTAGAAWRVLVCRSGLHYACHDRQHRAGAQPRRGCYRLNTPPRVWASIDHRAADLQDLFFNEPWFLFEGLGYTALAWIGLGPGSQRRWWGRQRNRRDLRAYRDRAALGDRCHQQSDHRLITPPLPGGGTGRAKCHGLSRMFQ
jgi:hypothetical protein